MENQPQTRIYAHHPSDLLSKLATRRTEHTLPLNIANKKLFSITELEHGGSFPIGEDDG